MRIAFISYEYPPDTALGGIATYVHQAARMLRQRGHEVEVFAGSPERTGSETVDGLIVHRIGVAERQDFAGEVGPIFAKRHAEAPFDVLEGPDYGADASEAVRLAPEIPLVVRLHTPRYLATAINSLELRAPSDADANVDALRQGELPRWLCDLENDPERRHTLDADEVAAPSRAIGAQVAQDWKLDPERLSSIPNVFAPAPELLGLPIETQTNTVLFLGRLEARKGVIDFAKAIPQILREFPAARFRFVGRPMRSPDPDRNMQQYLESLLEGSQDRVEFVGQVAPENVPEMLVSADICVFPSLWENFAMACLEAMAAGRGVVASRSGGMAEMLGSPETGRLIPPHSPEALVEAVLELLQAPKLRWQLGQAARQRILTEYNTDRIAALQEASYQRAIARRCQQGPRPMPS